jgi:serine protease AprX
MEIDMRMKRVVASVVAFLFLIVFLSRDGTLLARLAVEVCPASHTKLDAAMHNRIHAASSSSRLQAIVGVRVGTLDSVLSAVALLGAEIHAIHRGLPALSLEVGVSALGTLAALPSVLSISIDAPLSEARSLHPGDVLAARTVEEGAGGSVTHLRETLGLDGRLTGTGVGVAVIDSGLQAQVGFAGRVRAFQDFTGAGGPLQDDYGHGTHVSGLIGGTGTTDGLFQGVAPGVTFIVLKVLDANGYGRTSDVISAIEYAIANKASLGINIINLSLGHPIYEPAATDPLVRAVEAATRAGILVVVSAGNYGTNATTGLPGYAGVTSPANAASAITVGALKTFGTIERTDDRIATYSSRGPTWYDARVKVDLAAPGDKLIATAAKNSTLYQQYPVLRVGSGYMRLSGTSMATGVVTGVAALMVEANAAASGGSRPKLTPNALKAALQYTAFAVGTNEGVSADMLTVGAGAINAVGAIETAAGVDTSQPVGERWITTRLVRNTVIGGETLAWSESVLWDYAVASGDVLETNQPAWASSVVWGSNVVWTNAVVWGNALVWGNTAVWSSSVVWGSNATSGTDGTSVVWGSLYEIQE